jgi:hypothetical protein
MNLRPVPAMLVLAVLASLPLRAGTAEEWIARARAYLGEDAALDAVTTIHYKGTLEVTTKVPAPDDKSKTVEQQLRLPVEIIFQKPLQQRMTVTRAEAVDVTVLDDYEGWAKRTDARNPADWRLRLLDAEQIKQFRANTWENLNFFRGLEKKGGKVELGGEAVVDGVASVQLSFAHAGNIVFSRFFDKATGRLIKTVTEHGGEIREVGEIIVNGVRFPKRVINKAATGQVTTIEFDTIVLNEHFPAADFAVPPMPAN